jgi:autotransporter-associated beta strand protein
LTLGSEVSAKAAAVTASIAGRLALGGNTRSFVVEDGALVDDLLVTASIADGGAAAGLLKQGAGRLILAGANTFSGATSVEAGALLVNGTLANSTVTVQPGARLGGTGSLRALTSTGGVIAPGASPGRLRVLGEVRFDAATTLLLELNGATAGTGHDQLAGGGQVSLGGCTLQLVPGFTPLGSEVFTLVANDSAWPTSGAFAGLPEGAEMPLGGQRFRLSYAAGSGNDVVLQPIPRPDLSIARAATGVWLSWPASFEGYLLESNADIGTVDWVAVPEPPILVGGRRQVQLLLEPGPLFFRLRRTDI